MSIPVFFFQAEDGIRDFHVTGVQTCALPIFEHVQRYAAEHGAELVVVHSTVPVGTCDANGWVHSPVRGRHPNLVGGLRKFVKHRSEERRVGEGCGSRWEPWACTKESVEAACR